MHETDYFWVSKNTDKRFTKHPCIVLGRGRLDEEPTVHMKGQPLYIIELEANSKNNFAKANARYYASLKEQDNG